MKEKEAKNLRLDASKVLGTDVEQLLEANSVEIDKTEIGEVFFFDGRPLLVRNELVLFPTLYFEELFSVIPKIVVDMGAVPYVCKGADVMTPGVVTIKGEFKKSDLLLVVDERYSKPLAVSIAFFGSEEMKFLNGGKIAKNLHYVGDKLWNYLRKS
jgi:PUA domain protein